MAEELSRTVQTPQAVKGSGAAQSLDALSRLAMREALESSGGNVSQAARVLGVSRQTLYRKLKD
jgi:transcriptional regulator of acetoin/glycerol metabolism